MAVVETLMNLRASGVPKMCLKDQKALWVWITTFANHVTVEEVRQELLDLWGGSPMHKEEEEPEDEPDEVFDHGVWGDGREA